MDDTAASTLIAWLDREMWLVTARSGDRQSGLIATFVNAASIVTDAPRMLVGLAKQHRTCELVEASGAFGLHLLGEQHIDWVWRFGLASGRDVEKFDRLTVHTAVTGSPLLASAVGWLDCRVETSMDIGDRTIFLGAVVEASVTKFGPPLTLKQVLEQAAHEKIMELKRQRHYDSLIDAECIRQWRQLRDEKEQRQT